MSRIHITLAVIILLEILILFIGCQSDSHDPLAPKTVLAPDEVLSDDLASLNTTWDSAKSTTLWGYYQVAYDPRQHSFDVIPVRGPEFAWNVVTFLQPPTGSLDNLLISILDDSTFFSSGRIDVRVVLHHPFPTMPQYTGFDVCGIFMTEGSRVCPGNPNLRYADPESDPTLLNADGYTRWMNPTEFLSGDVLGYEPGFWGTSESSENSGFVAGATINPYKYFAHGLGPDDSLHDWLDDPANIADRGIFPTSASCARDYELLFPFVDSELVFIFNYAVLANWIEPVVNPVTDPLTDFPPEANAQYPQHIFVTDNSEVYYTPDDAGGMLSFDIEVFDWDAILIPTGIPNEVTKFTFWSDDPLIPGGWVETLSTEVEWNSGFTASTSVAHVELTGMAPEDDGEHSVWIGIESASPSSYDQGFGAIVPDDLIAAYVNVQLKVADCPKAFVLSLDTDTAGSDSFLDDVLIDGTGFVDGDGLGVWLEQIVAGGAAPGPGNPYQIYGSDIKFIDNKTISADFDLTDAPIGDYGCGCINGCGITSPPDENKDSTGDTLKIKVVPPSPFNITLSTGRNSELPAALTSLFVSWTSTYNAQQYKIFVKGYSVLGTIVFSTLVGTTTGTTYEIVLDSLPVSEAGVLEVWLTATGQTDNTEYESLPSRSVFMYFQGFEAGMGNWSLIAENKLYLWFERSPYGQAYDSVWSVNSSGMVPSYPDLWMTMATPAIPEIEGAGTVKFEFLHFFSGIHFNNGYQVGWCDTLPAEGHPTVVDYEPITSAVYGYDYNSTSSPALVSEFNIPAADSYNFGSEYWGPTPDTWMMSGFDMSIILGDGIPNYILIGFAGTDYNYFEISIDEVAVLIY